MNEVVRSQDNNMINKLSIILFVTLFLLRFPFLFAGVFGLIGSSMLEIYLCGTYFCTGLFLCLNRTRLEQYNFSFVAMLIFFLSAVVALMYDSNDFTAWFRFVLAIGFLGFIIIKKDARFVQIPRKKIIKYTIFTLLLCIATPLFGWAINGFISNNGNQDPLTVNGVVDFFFFQLITAAISEEPLFRGFMTGYLRKRGIKEWITCLIVATSFWFAHIYYIDTGFNFWIYHPIIDLLLSIVVMKAKSVSYTMLLHASINALPMVLHYIQL